jgi:hypothetical protein
MTDPHIPVTTFEPKRTCAYLRELGIDPGAIPVDGWFRDYYEVYNPDNAGTSRERRTWPEGFEYEKLYAAWHDDMTSQEYQAWLHRDAPNAGT